MLLNMMRFWPPFLGAGIRVKKFNALGTDIIVQMKMRFWNKNYVGTHFGGSIYSMTDPFYMLMLMKALGKEYIVWDKSASIRYKIPAKGTLYAQFTLSPEQVNTIKLEVSERQKIESEFMVLITNEEGKTVAEVKKILSISKKP
jgi:hypothetical protein